MTAKSGKSFDATLQVNAEKKGIEFIFGENKSLKERQEQRQDRQQGKAPRKLCGLELSEKQREALDNGRTLYLKNMIDKEGQPFNAYVRMDLSLIHILDSASAMPAFMPVSTALTPAEMPCEALAEELPATPSNEEPTLRNNWVLTLSK